MSYTLNLYLYCRNLYDIDCGFVDYKYLIKKTVKKLLILNRNQMLMYLIYVLVEYKKN